MNLVQIYSTPIWEVFYYDFEKNKQQFLDCVINFRKENPIGIGKSNVNGYQSPMTLGKEKALEPLFKFICQTTVMTAMIDLQFIDCDIIITSAWVNFNESSNHYKMEHIHNDTFSGVFYLSIPENSGNLVFTNPGLNPLWQGTSLVDSKNKYNADKLKIYPQEGQIMLWPSYISHSVEPNNHNLPRISISFNVLCVPKNDMVEQDDTQNNTPNRAHK